jgi:plastocyanin
VAVVRVILATIVAAGLFSAFASPVASARAPVAVEVDDDFFSPTALRVDWGTRVRFNWVGVNAHDVATNDNSPVFFNSGVKQGTGQFFSRRFTQAGTYGIICTLHEEMTMTLRVRRKPPPS